jgi:hypothetical protein
MLLWVSESSGAHLAVVHANKRAFSSIVQISLAGGPVILPLRAIENNGTDFDIFATHAEKGPLLRLTIYTLIYFG